MEVRYPIKVLYTLGTSQLMLARAEAIGCRPVKPRPNATNPAEKHASTTLKECLSALCRASPELLADPRADHSVYALDPLQTPELMVGRGLLTWLLAESGRIVGTVREDYVDGEELEVLEIRLSLAQTVAVSRAQHATSLQNISHPVTPTASAHLSPPSTPSGQSQSHRTSTRIRIKSTARAKEKAAAAAAAPPVPKKRGPRKGASKTSTTPSQATLAPNPVTSTSSVPVAHVPEPSAVSPAPSRPHSRVSSVSSLAHSQSQTQPQSRPRPPTSFGSTSTSSFSIQPSQSSHLSSQTPQPQPYSPGKSLARLLLAASANSSNSSVSSSVGTPLFDSLVERLKTAGLLGQPGVDQLAPTDAQKQAILSLIGKMSGSSPGRKDGSGGQGSLKGKERAIDEAKSFIPSPALTAARSPPANPSPSTAPSPAVISAPSPATLAAPSPSAFATPIPPPESSLGPRKREPEDQSDSTDSKRARLGVGLGEARTSSLGSLDSHLARGLKLEDGGYGSLSEISPSPSVASPAFSATSPIFAAPSPSLSALSAPSPNLSVPSPNISAASPYTLSYPASAPPSVSLDSFTSQHGTWSNSQPAFSSQPGPSSSQPQPLAQPNSAFQSISQPNLFSSDPKLPPKSRRRTPRQTPLHEQTDLPQVAGPFVTPREQIGLPRVHAPPSPARCVAGPGRTKTNVGKKDNEAQRIGKELLVGTQNPEPEKRGEPEQLGEQDRAVSEEEVRVMLADGYYPPAGLGIGHRKLFGAKNVPGTEGGTGDSDMAELAPTPPVATPTLDSSRNRPTSSSKYYRSSDYDPAPRVQTQKPSNVPPKKLLPIPKHSPVAPPPVRRLPMMLTSPIRATGGRVSDPEEEKRRKGKARGGKNGRPVPQPVPAPVIERSPARQFPPSLNDYSPLKRLLKNAGINSLGDVLGQAGVLGLKDDSRSAGGGNSGRAGAKAAMIKEQEREVVDLTSDADEDDLPVPAKAPTIVQKSGTPNRQQPRTPTRQPGTSTTPPLAERVQFTAHQNAGHKIATPPRSTRTNPIARAVSPLFAATETATARYAYTQYPSSENLSIPPDLPPSSPPPMSDSDLDAGSGVEGDGKDAYREPTKYTDAESSDGGFDAGGRDIDGSDIEQQLNPDVDEDEDENGGAWDETIRPTEPVAEGLGYTAPGDILPDGGPETTTDAELDLVTLANFLDMLDGQVGAEVESGLELEQFGAELEAVLGQQLPTDPTDALSDPAALDFSWLDALGSSEVGQVEFESGESTWNAIQTEDTIPEQDISEILAVLGAG